jgi:mRNA interferase MazF
VLPAKSALRVKSASHHYCNLQRLGFPFTDQTASTKRPAVVVSADAYHQRRPDVIVMAVTSQILWPAGALGEVLIGDW